MPSTSISRSVKGRYLPVSNTGNRCSSAEPLPPLFSYFPASTLIVNTGDLEASAERFQNEARARFENRGVDPMRPLLPPELLWLRSDELFSELKNGRACSWKPNVWRTKRQILIWATRRCRTSPSRRRTKRRWIICAASSSPLPVR
ncbi:hypothetical protein LNQ03_07295 [Klebsiella pneumoniae subsp. pneumoniae]|nr:hypothetical protein [Klebsiella pneumoniae subsp. pneumoniae]